MIISLSLTLRLNGFMPVVDTTAAHLTNAPSLPTARAGHSDPSRHCVGLDPDHRCSWCRCLHVEGTLAEKTQPSNIHPYPRGYAGVHSAHHRKGRDGRFRAAEQHFPEIEVDA